MSELLLEKPDEPKESNEKVTSKAEESGETQLENSFLQRQISASVQFTGPS